MITLPAGPQRRKTRIGNEPEPSRTHPLNWNATLQKGSYGMEHIENQLGRTEQQIEQLIRIVAHLNERVIYLEKKLNDRHWQESDIMKFVMKR
jgi:hypothetical protein